MKNERHELPSTGGPGTRFFYILGTLLTGLVAAFLFARKRREG